MSSEQKRRALAVVLVLWAAAVVGAKALEQAGALDFSDALGRVWWFSFLLLGTALLGAVFQPLLKEYFLKKNHPAVVREPALLLTDYETLAGYYPIAFVVILLGAAVFSPLFYGSQTLFLVKNAEIFWWAVLGTGILNAFLFYFMNKAYRYGDLSLVSATWALSPVFAIPISFVVYDALREQALLTSPGLSFAGVIGIGIVIASLLLVVFISKKQGEPPAAVSGDWFTRYPVVSGVVGSLIAAISINLDKVAVEAGNPFLMVAVVALIVSFVTGGWTIAQSGFRRLAFIFKRYWKSFLVLGSLYGVILAIMAITLLGENVNYQGTIKRFSIVFATLYGIWIFGEGDTSFGKAARVLLALVAFSGVVVIALLG